MMKTMRRGRSSGRNSNSVPHTVQLRGSWQGILISTFLVAFLFLMSSTEDTKGVYQNRYLRDETAAVKSVVKSVEGKEGVKDGRGVTKNKEEVKDFKAEEKEEVQSGGGSSKRPVIHTYFDQNKNRPGKRNTEEQQSMLVFWKKVWSDAGWDPVVITLEDAKRHPKFNEWHAQLEKLDIGYYDIMCFERWMAMAMVGGGWMADYDTYPLHKQVAKDLTLPNDGRFTAYDPNPKSAVPSLLSGTAEEWMRMTNEIMQYVPKHEGEFYSDMLALRDFNVDTPGKFSRVFNVLRHIYMTRDGTVECDKYKDMIAIHFSHESKAQSMLNGIFVENKDAPSRAYYAHRFLNFYHKHCDGDAAADAEKMEVPFNNFYPFDDIELHESLTS